MGIDLLQRWRDEPAPLDGILSAHFRQARFIGSKDRQAIAELVYGILRHQGRLQWALAQSGWDGPADGRILALAFQALFGDGVFDQVLDGSRFAAPAPDAAEAALLSSLAALREGAFEFPDAVRAELPDWAVEGFIGSFGDNAMREAEALITEAPVDLRVNTLKTDRATALDILRRRGIEATATPISPIGIRLNRRVPLAGERIFKEGLVEIQDEGSQIAALLVAPEPGQQVADFCAGAGGKSLALAALMQGKGRILASDVSEGRLRRAKTRMKRAGIDNIEPRLLSSARDKWVKKQKGKFDRVLVDAPCSGTGAWRRNPDARWKPMDLPKLHEEQSEILASASRLVRPGGRLIYVTCSLLASENGDRIDRFLEQDTTFQPVNPSKIWAEQGLGGHPRFKNDRLTLTPSKDGTDGFFVAVLEKAAERSQTTGD